MRVDNAAFVAQETGFAVADIPASLTAGPYTSAMLMQTAVGANSAKGKEGRCPD